MVDFEFRFDCAMPYFLYGRHVADVPFTVTIAGECVPNAEGGSWEILDICYEDFEGDKHYLSGAAFDYEKKNILELHTQAIDREFAEECRKIDEEWGDTMGDYSYELYKDSVYA